jgi:hypothetical protein
MYKVVWQTRQHDTAAPYAADVACYEDLAQVVERIIAASPDLVSLRIEQTMLWGVYHIAARAQYDIALRANGKLSQLKRITMKKTLLACACVFAAVVTVAAITANPLRLFGLIPLPTYQLVVLNGTGTGRLPRGGHREHQRGAASQARRCINGPSSTASRSPCPWGPQASSRCPRRIRSLRPSRSEPTGPSCHSQRRSSPRGW